MRTIAIVNQKGGCGKTTTAINLSSCLALEGRRVLLVDLDPQAHSTLGLSVNPDSLDRSLFDVLSDQVQLDEILKETVSPNLCLAPCNVTLSAIEQVLSGLKDRESRLSRKILSLKRDFDYILIDCPPSVGLLTFNALVAADELIVPLETGRFSVDGVLKLMETIDLLNARLGKHLAARVLPTMVDRRTARARENLSRIYDQFKGMFFSTAIHLNEKLREAASLGRPISEVDVNSSGFKDYLDLAQEVLATEKKNVVEKRILKTVAQDVFKLRPVQEAIFFTIQDSTAHDVKLAGNFNEWVPDRNVISYREEDGIWRKVISLNPGRYQYRYVVDGEWREDPYNPNVIQNDFGGFNSILDIA